MPKIVQVLWVFRKFSLLQNIKKMMGEPFVNMKKKFFQLGRRKTTFKRNLQSNLGGKRVIKLVDPTPKENQLGI